jgi:LacI family transcriptional regulator
MVTIKDVAREAGVSIATVSRVYNNSDLVRADTRAHVQAVAARLGYSPHGSARSLITSKTSTIGVLLPDLYGEFFSEVIRGIDQTAQREGYHLLVSSSHDAASEIDAALRSMRGRVDGLIVMSPNLDAHVAVRRLAAHFPVVLLNAAVDGEGDEDALDAITVANRDGAHAMVRHLLRLGHRRIAIITGAARNFDALERLRGYRAALHAAGIAPRPEWEQSGDFSEGSGYRAAREILRLEPRPTAIFASNDAMAIGALSALHEAGVRVPEEIAVAGFDDIPMAKYMNPPLSTVHVEISALGERATERLLEVMQEPASAASRRRQVVLPTTLVIRGSCGGGPP